jgi:hypothetical protein
MKARAKDEVETCGKDESWQSDCLHDIAKAIVSEWGKMTRILNMVDFENREKGHCQWQKKDVKEVSVNPETEEGQS